MFSLHRDIKPPNSKGMMLIISALTFTRALKCTGSVSLCGNGPPDTCYLPECLLWAFTTHRSLAEKVKLLTSGRKKKRLVSDTSPEFESRAKMSGNNILHILISGVRLSADV